MSIELILFGFTAIILDIFIISITTKYLYNFWKRVKGLGEEE
jgi:hypothetical protein